jgi:hypothetical protein
LLGIAEH